jgi:cold shock CspA family protein
MRKGIVVLFHRTRGWGFIREEKSGVEWFFHVSNAVPNFAPELGAAVEFELGPPLRLGRKDQATNIRYLSDGAWELQKKLMQTLGGGAN